jgi:DNA-binding transcriptional ArsR family regulator
MMAYSKKESFSEQDVTLAELAKAISHPARIAILKILSRSTCICGEIVDELPLSQSTVSQHLRALKDVGLVQGEIEGAAVCYCIDPAGIEKLSKLFGQLLSRVGKDIDFSKKCC